MINIPEYITSFERYSIIIVFAVIIIIGAILWFFRERTKKKYLSIYKKQISFAVVLCFLLVTAILFTAEKKDLAQILIIPIITGLIASVFYGLFDIQSEPQFAEKVSQDVLGNIYATIPQKVYSPSEKIPAFKSQFEKDLSASMIKSQNYYYSGVNMIVASKCIVSSIKKKNTCLSKMYFIIPDLNEKESDTDDTKQYKQSDKFKLIKSISDINDACTKANHQIVAEFYILPYRPTIHIHQTDDTCFWGIVDKMGKYECPTTYCYLKIDSEESMYSTIYSLMGTTRERVNNQLLHSKIFTVTWNVKGTQKQKDGMIRYKDKGIFHCVKISEFVSNMKIIETKAK